MRDAANAIREKYEASPPKDRELYIPAQTYIKAIVGMSQMLERPDVDKVIGELEKLKKTTLSNLLAFMHTFNLRFGVATTPEAQEIYQSQLFPAMAALRDRVVQEAGPVGGQLGGNNVGSPIDVFQGMTFNQAVGQPLSPSRSGAP